MFKFKPNFKLLFVIGFTVLFAFPFRHVFLSVFSIHFLPFLCAVLAPLLALSLALYSGRNSISRYELWTSIIFALAMSVISICIGWQISAFACALSPLLGPVICSWTRIPIGVDISYMDGVPQSGSGSGSSSQPPVSGSSSHPPVNDNPSLVDPRSTDRSYYQTGSEYTLYRLSEELEPLIEEIRSSPDYHYKDRITVGNIEEAWKKAKLPIGTFREHMTLFCENHNSNDPKVIKFAEMYLARTLPAKQYIYLVGDGKNSSIRNKITDAIKEFENNKISLYKDLD